MPLFTPSLATELIAQKLKDNAPMTELEFFAVELMKWKVSPERAEMLDGDRYYRGDHDILQRKRTAIGPDGKLQEVANLPNNRIVDNQYAKHCDQKKNYLLGKPISFESDNKGYAKAIKSILGKKFMRTLKNAGEEALNGGIAWLYPYYNQTGELTFKLFSAYEILPFWIDSDHTELDCALRFYTGEVYEGKEEKTIEKVDIFTINGLTTYTLDAGVLTLDPDSPGGSYIAATGPNGETEYFNWEKLPLIPIKSNAKEIPLLRRVRQLQDAINLILSDFTNNMQEDVRNTILVLKNYDGTDLGEFRRNLSTFGAVKVRAVEGAEGGVETLTIEVNSENYSTILKLLKNALIENARSYDAKDDRLNGNPNQMNIQSMYSDIDLDANDMETELQASFEDIFWFVNKHLANQGLGEYDGTEINVIFNRDILINEGEAIDNCAKSVGIISDETIIGQHPWTGDPAAELARIQAEKEAAATEVDAYRAAFESTTGGSKKSAIPGEGPEGGALNE